MAYAKKTKFSIDIPEFRYLDGKKLKRQDAMDIMLGVRPTKVVGFCSETAMNVLDTGDELVVVHSVWVKP